MVTDGVEVYRIIERRPVEESHVRCVAKLVAAAGIAATLALPAVGAEKVFRYAFNVGETGFDPVELSDLYSSNLIDNIFDAPLSTTTSRGR